MNELELNALSQQVIGAAIEVHKELGPGLLEHIYQSALLYELSLRGLRAEKEVEIPLFYKGVVLNAAYRADIIVENEVIIELKSTENDNPLYKKQLLSYLRLHNKKLGLLINFNKIRLVDGIDRLVNKL